MVEFGSTILFNDANLVAYYKLEDVNDNKGSRNLTNNGSVTFAAAKFNNGMVGDGSNTKYLNRLTDNYGLAGNGDCSFSMQVKIVAAPSSGNQWAFVFHRSTTTAARFITLYYKNNGGTLQLKVDNSDGVSFATYNVDLGTSAFHNIVLVRNGTSGLNLYLDGVNTSTTIAQGTADGGSQNDFWVGADGGNVGANAIIDDLAVFSRALTQTDVNMINGGDKILKTNKFW